MLVIRDEQMAVFERAAMQKFEDRTLDHLRQCFPRDLEILGQDKARWLIQDGIRRARGYGITGERGSWLFIDMMLQLGAGFDTDPQLPWAQAALTGDALDEHDRADRLEASLDGYLRKVCGAGGEHFRAALERLRDSTPAAPAAMGSCPNFESAMLLELQALFPEKYSFGGQELAGLLIWSGIQRAHRYGLNSLPGTLLFIEFTFLFGSGFDRDPQFGWFTETVSDAAQAAERKKIKRLHEQAKAHIGTWLKERKEAE